MNPEYQTGQPTTGISEATIDSFDIWKLAPWALQNMLLRVWIVVSLDRFFTVK